MFTLAAAASAPAPSTAPAAPAVGDAAADFTLKTVDDKSVRLHELTAKSPVVLVVLRGWPGYQCPLCTKQVAQFMARKSDFADADAHVLLVYPGAAEKLDEHARQFLQHDLPPHFSFVIDPDYTFTNQYNLRWNARNETAYPSTFVIDRVNKIRFAKVSKTHGGRTNADEVLKALRGL